MVHATQSLRPWLTHRRMWLKWAGVVASGTAMLAWPTVSAWQAAVAVVLGFLWFYPNEYAVHRWAYHGLAPTKAGRITSAQHIRHHHDPQELDALFNDPRVSVTFGIVYFLLGWAIAGLPLAAAFTFGNFLGLVHYEYVHFTAHRPGVTPWMPWLRPLKQMHLWHHYKSEHWWFGVTSRIFDRLLGSWSDPGEVERSDTVRTIVPPAPREHEVAMD